MTFLYECLRTVYSLGYSGSLYYLSECYPQWLNCSYFFDHSEIAKKFWNKYNRSKDLDENGKFQRPVLLLKSSLKLILTFILRAHWPPFFVTYWLFHKYSNPYLFFFFWDGTFHFGDPIRDTQFFTLKAFKFVTVSKNSISVFLPKYLSTLKITFNLSLKKRKLRSCREVWGLVSTQFLVILSFSPLITPGRGLILLLAPWNYIVHLKV